MRSDKRAGPWPRAALFALSLAGVLGLLLPLPDSAAWLRLSLNIAHVPLFAVWTALLLRNWLDWRGPRHAMRVCAGFAMSVALASEAAQALQPSRQVDALDAFSNMAGVGLGLAFGRWCWRARFADA